VWVSDCYAPCLRSCLPHCLEIRPDFIAKEQCFFVWLYNQRHRDLLGHNVSHKAPDVPAGNCFWVHGLDWCTGTNDGPQGETWAFLAASMFYCMNQTSIYGNQVLGCGPGTTGPGVKQCVLPTLFTTLQAGCSCFSTCTVHSSSEKMLKVMVSRCLL
jgi:hypothetical protein